MHVGAQIGQIVFDQVQIGLVLDAPLVYAPKVGGAGAAVAAVDVVALGEQQLSNICTVLAIDSGNDDGCHYLLLVNIVFIIF